MMVGIEWTSPAQPAGRSIWVVPRDSFLPSQGGRDFFIAEVEMAEDLKIIEKNALEALAAVKDGTALENWRISFLGRSSPLMLVFGGLGTLSKEERPAVGQRANEVKKALEAAFAQREDELRQASLKHSLEHEGLDVTLPGRSI